MKYSTGQLIVERALDLPDLDRLVEESVRETYRFVLRLILDWRTGLNRFDKPGELLLVARQSARISGVCGLNVDPYASDPLVGRLRHLYVALAVRRKGIGRALVGRVVAEARRSFKTLTLRTNSPSAAAFYEALGFRPTITHPHTTHALGLD